MCYASVIAALGFSSAMLLVHNIINGWAATGVALGTVTSLGVDCVALDEAGRARHA